MAPDRQASGGGVIGAAVVQDGGFLRIVGRNGEEVQGSLFRVILCDFEKSGSRCGGGLASFGRGVLVFLRGLWGGSVVDLLGGLRAVLGRFRQGVAGEGEEGEVEDAADVHVSMVNCVVMRTEGLTRQHKLQSN